ERAVGHDLRRAQLVTTVDQRDLVREAREERGLLHRGVAAAHDGDVLVAEEEAVARGAPRDAAAGQALLVVEAELTVGGSGREDDRARPVRLPVAGDDRLDGALEVEQRGVVPLDARAEPL